MSLGLSDNNKKHHYEIKGPVIKGKKFWWQERLSHYNDHSKMKFL
jgi:hypothetical protein